VVQGDDENSYTYQCENQACVDAINNTPTGVWVTVVALGAKDEATLDITLPTDYQAPPATHGVTNAPQRTNGGGPVSDPQRPESVAQAFAEALRAAREVRIAYEDEFGEDLTAIDKEIAATILINAERSRWQMPMRVVPPPDPNDPADKETVQAILELLTTQAVPDQVRESIESLIADGINVEKATKTVAYLRAQPAAAEQGALPWEA
jgi:hypothetical protein